MTHRLLLSALAGVLLAACSSASDATPPTAKVSSPPTAVGSPPAATPTAMIALPAPSPSPAASPNGSPAPVALASPSPVAVASPAASPVAQASPVGAVLVTPGAAPNPNGPRFVVVAERSEASYRARETFVSKPGLAEAVGRTNEIEGEIQLDADGVLRGRVLGMRIDLRTLTSDQPRRDNFIRQNTLRTDQFPYADFRSTESAGPALFRPGEEAAFQIPGLMTIRGQERSIVWEARAKLDGTTITGSATARVRLTDFGLEPPRLAILSVEDEMTWQIDLVAERVP